MPTTPVVRPAAATAQYLLQFLVLGLIISVSVCVASQLCQNCWTDRAAFGGYFDLSYKEICGISENKCTFVPNWTQTMLPRHVDHRPVTISSPFRSIAHFLLLIFPVAIFFCSLKYRCPSFRTITLCCSFFLPALFLLLSFPVAQFSIAHFSGCCFFPLPLFLTLIFLLPFFPTLLFFVAEFYRCPIFRCHFFRCPFCCESLTGSRHPLGVAD